MQKMVAHLNKLHDQLSPDIQAIEFDGVPWYAQLSAFQQVLDYRTRDLEKTEKE